MNVTSHCAVFRINSCKFCISFEGNPHVTGVPVLKMAILAELSEVKRPIWGLPIVKNRFLKIKAIPLSF
jgi:hypothetical protein